MYDVDIRTLQRIEKGEFNPSLKVLIQLAKSFDYTLSDFFFQGRLKMIFSKENWLIGF